MSINSSSFPTKWFGNPHQPNSGLVKEIRTNGYKNPYTGKLTDCIRLHIPRTTGVDGMSYGADASVTIGQSVTTTYWVKAVSETAVGRSVSFQHYNYGGPGGANGFYGGVTLGAVGEWQRVALTFTPTHNTLISYWFPQGDYVYSFDLANIQVEQKSHATPFIAGTRSTTQGLLPLVSNSTLDLSNVSFDSNAQVIWDGTDDYIDITKTASNLGIYDAPYTMEAVFKVTNTLSGDNMIFGTNQTAYRQGMHNGLRNGNIYFAHYSADYAAGSVALNEMVHISWVYSGTTAFIYKNGVLQGSSDIASFIGTTNIQIGKSWVYFQGGIIPVAKIYNRALTAAEVQQNYKHYKTRFNLS